MCFSRNLHSDYIRMDVTCDYVVMVLCVYVLVLVSVLTERGYEKDAR